MAYRVWGQEEVTLLLDCIERQKDKWARVKGRAKNREVRELVYEVLEGLQEIDDRINAALEWVEEDTDAANRSREY